MPRDAQEMHLPTDLLGLTPGTYDALRADSNFEAALGPACHQIIGQISSLSVRKYSEEMWQRFRSARKDVYSLVATELTKTNGSTECMGVPFESMDFWDLRKSADLLSCKESDRLLMNFLAVAASIDDNGRVATPIEAAVMERSLSDLENNIGAWKRQRNP